MSWIPGFENADAAAVLALRPAARSRLRELEARLWTSGLDPALTELVRRRVGRLLGLPDRGGAPGQATGERTRAALGFAEQYVLDPSGITDEQTTELNQLFTEPELTALTFAVAVFDALGRIEIVLGSGAEAAS